MKRKKIIYKNCFKTSGLKTGMHMINCPIVHAWFSNSSKKQVHDLQCENGPYKFFPLILFGAKHKLVQNTTFSTLNSVLVNYKRNAKRIRKTCTMIFVCLFNTCRGVQAAQDPVCIQTLVLSPQHWRTTSSTPLY